MTTLSGREVLRLLADGASLDEFECRHTSKAEEWRDLQSFFVGVFTSGEFEFRRRPITMTVTLTVPVPLRVEPKEGAAIWLTDKEGKAIRWKWIGDKSDKYMLAAGDLYATEAEAQARADAMKKAFGGGE